MAEGKPSFRQAVGQVIEAAEKDTTDALCQLSRALHIFDKETVSLRERMAELTRPAAEAQPQEDPVEKTLPDHLLQVLWLVVVAGAMVAFAAGFWLGRHTH